MATADHYANQEFWDFASEVVDRVQALYGNCAVFEHGAQTHGSRLGCGADHAHLHVVPFSQSLSVAAAKFNEQLNWSTCKATELKTAVAGRDYLFVADKFAGSETIGRVCMPETPVSQYFRQVLANSVGLGDMYDYKAHPMLDLASQSARELRASATSLAGHS